MIQNFWHLMCYSVIYDVGVVSQQWLYVSLVLRTDIYNLLAQSALSYCAVLGEFVVEFYRATLCVSAVFCLSVCLSVTFVHSIQTAKDIVKLLCRTGNLIIVVFWPRRRYLIPRGTLQRGAKYKGVGKLCDFRLKSPSLSETVQDRPMVAMERW